MMGKMTFSMSAECLNAGGHIFIDMLSVITMSVIYWCMYVYSYAECHYVWRRIFVVLHCVVLSVIMLSLN
jgi:hypothetical protein